MHYIEKFSIFSVFLYFHENCNFSNKDTEQDRNLLENLIISSFSVK